MIAGQQSFKERLAHERALANAARDQQGRPAPDLEVDEWDGEEGAVDVLDIHMDDESEQPHAYAQTASAAESAHGSAELGDSILEDSPDPPKPEMSNLSALVALSRLGRKKTPADRLEAYLAPLPVETRERIAMVIAENGWSMDDPELVTAMLMGHLAAIGHVASESIDESGRALDRSLSEAKAYYDDLPSVIEQALEEGKAELRRAAESVSQVAEAYEAAIKEGLKAAALETASLAAEGLSRLLAASSARADEELTAQLARLGEFEELCEQRLKGALARMVDGAQRRISHEMAASQRKMRGGMMTTMACAGAVAGFLAAMAWMRLV